MGYPYVRYVKTNTSHVMGIVNVSRITRLTQSMQRHHGLRDLRFRIGTKQLLLNGLHQVQERVLLNYLLPM